VVGLAKTLQRKKNDSDSTEVQEDDEIQSTIYINSYEIDDYYPVKDIIQPTSNSSRTFVSEETEIKSAETFKDVTNTKLEPQHEQRSDNYRSALNSISKNENNNYPIFCF